LLPSGATSRERRTRRCALSNSNANSDLNPNCNSNLDPNPNCDSNLDPNPNCNSNLDPDPNAYTWTYYAQRHEA
jgi:hypothetical protein